MKYASARVRRCLSTEGPVSAKSRAEKCLSDVRGGKALPAHSCLLIARQVANGY